MTRLDRLPRLALFTAAALAVLLVAKTGRDLKLHAVQVSTLLAAAAVAVSRPGRLAATRPFAVPAIAWAALTGTAILTARLHGSLASTAGDEIARQAGFLIVLLLAVSVFARDDRRTLTGLWAATLLVVGGYAVIQRLGLDWVTEFRSFHPESRPFATFGNPDFLGTHAAMVFPLFAATALTATGVRRRNGWTTVAVLALVTLVLTQSRGAILGAGGGTALMLILHPAPGIRLRARKLLIPALLLLAGVAFLSRGILARRTDRPLLWLGTGRMIAARPLTGWGPGAFAAEFPAFAPPAFADRMKADNTFAEHPHSEYLHVAVESGILGLGMFLWLLATVLRPVARNALAGDGWSAGALGGLAAVLIHIAVDRNFRLASTAGPFWLLAGAALCRNDPVSPKSSSSPYRLFSSFFFLILLLIAARSLSPLRASIKVESEVDFLKQASGLSAAELVKRQDALGGQPSYWVELGNTYAKENNFPAAVGAFQQALRLDTGVESAKNNLGNCYFMMSKFPDAERVYRDLLVTSPDHKDARFNLAMALYYQRKIKEALLEVDEILRRDPANAKAMALRQQLAP